MLKKIAIGCAAVLVSGGIFAIAQTFTPGFPTINGPSYCASTTNNVCVSTIPAGPNFTGQETIPADTNATPIGALQAGRISVPSLINNYNVLVGSDFGQNLWQRGTTPISALGIGGQVFMGADGWFFINQATTSVQTTTVSKQTGATDQPPGSIASMRVQRVNAQTGVGVVCTGQLTPNDSTPPFVSTQNTLNSNIPANQRTAIFSVDMLAGANFSPAGVNMVIAYHTAADAAASANGQGTNTNTFATSLTGTQNITNYTEAVNTLTPITTTWTRYSVAATIPLNVPTTTTNILGIGVKLCVTPVGTAGANDWFEIGNAQLEYRSGTSFAPSPYDRHLLSDEWQLETARYYQINENGSGTVIYCPGQAGATNTWNVVCQFPNRMRITPTTTPITAGGFKVNAAGTLQTVTNLSVTGLTNNQYQGGLGGNATITAGQGTTFDGSGAGTGVLGWSAEP
jgi:hypothetical protein